MLAGDDETIEYAIAFLEVRPYFFRSGYKYKSSMRVLRNCPLFSAQGNRYDQPGHGIYSIAKNEDALTHARQSPDDTAVHPYRRVAKVSLFCEFAATRLSRTLDFTGFLGGGLSEGGTICV